MPLEVITVPCLSDNYAYVIADPSTNRAAVVDVPEGGPINRVLTEKGLHLDTVLLTHHHADHVQGLSELTGVSDAAIIGAAADAHRLPALTQQVAEGDSFAVLGEDVQVIDVSGHTVGHVAYVIPGIAHAFTGDSLMALGCGRLFEGTPAQMWKSMQKLLALPDETIICSGHEYTQSNAAFAVTVDPDNPDLIYRHKQVIAARAKGQPTVPSTLLIERKTNPFLRPDEPALRAHIGIQNADNAAVFAEVRKRKDNF